MGLNEGRRPRAAHRRLAADVLRLDPASMKGAARERRIRDLLIRHFADVPPQ